MWTEGSRPAASAWATWARPISPPSTVTKELLDIFWALKGATLKPRLLNILQKAVTAMDLPTSLPVPRNMSALVK